jgi:hypothetical protein
MSARGRGYKKVNYAVNSWRVYVMKFDEMKTWQAMNCIEAAAALGFNDLLLTTANKVELHKLLCGWAERHADLRARWAAEDKENVPCASP